MSIMTVRCLNIFRGEKIMKRIAVLFLIIYISILSFAEVNDKVGVLTEEERGKLQTRLEEVSKTTGVNFYINYSKEGETPQLKEVEKSVIIDLIKVDSSNLKVKVNFTQDIEVEEYREEVEGTLENLEEFLNEGKNLEYSIELLGSLEELILKEKETEKIEKKEFAKKGNNKSKFLILLFILGGVFFYRKKMKSLKR